MGVLTVSKPHKAERALSKALRSLLLATQPRGLTGCVSPSLQLRKVNCFASDPVPVTHTGLQPISSDSKVCRHRAENTFIKYF